MPAQGLSLAGVISRPQFRGARFFIVCAALLVASPARAQHSAAEQQRPRRETLAPATLRDSLTRTTEPVARRVLLERLLRQYPYDPLLHTELSASLLANPLIRVGWSGPNVSATDRALDELKAALAADSLYVPAAVAMADYASRTHDPGDLAAARAALDRPARARPADAAAAVALARVAAEQAAAPGAVAAARRARSAGAGDGAVERAAGIALMLGGAAPEGGRTYLGALAGSPPVRLEYLGDARWLLDDSTFVAWRSHPELLADSLAAF